MNVSKRFVKQTFRNIKVFFATIIFLTVLPWILILFLPIYTWRYILGKLNSTFHPKEGNILSTKSAVFAADDMYCKPKCPLLVLFLIEGKMSLSKLREKVQEDMINKRKVSGDFTYPELQQCISKWMGFYFWRWDKQFEIKNHVKNYEGSLRNQVCEEDSLPILVNDLTNQPFKKGHSPWEIVLLSNVNIKPTREFYFVEGPEENKPRNQSVIIFRLHHSLADGISIQHLLMDVAGYAQPDKRVTGNRNRNISLINALTFPFRAPFETIGALLDCNDVNQWHLPESKLTGEFRSAASVPVSVDFIKEIKNSQDGVTFAGVVLAAVAGGIRNFMIERGIKIPTMIHCLTPLPMPGHSDKLRNHLTAAAIGLPLGEPTATNRLKAVSKHLKKLKVSAVPQMNYLFYPIVGGLFPFMAKHLFKHTFTTALLSSFEGPRESMQFLDYVVDDIIFAGGLLMGNIGMGMTLLSYNGSFRIVFGVDSAILPKNEDAQEIVKLIYEELFILRNLNNV
ncbi:unnamed protein product [Allacma fusca]|uniref:O-acyltransferase WSD1 C-terminal domain-containing protein n=1 Tax=Allacma fusca TaxID=39272 RepID=A0A8J2KTD5_9HEXA|nr:unnamed protein product [Allacma fusca]